MRYGFGSGWQPNVTNNKTTDNNTNAAVKEFFELRDFTKKCYQYETNEKICGESVE